MELAGRARRSTCASTPDIAVIPDAAARGSARNGCATAARRRPGDGRPTTQGAGRRHGVARTCPQGWTRDARARAGDVRARGRRGDGAVQRDAAGDASRRATTRSSATVSERRARTSDTGYEVVEYPHIHRRHVSEPATTRVKVIDVTIAPGLRVGYIMGVGDQVPAGDRAARGAVSS